MYNENRVKKLCSILSGYDVYGYFMGADFDLKYLTGIDPFPDERFKGMLVLKDQRKLFISPELYYEDFRRTLGEDIPIYIWSDGEGVEKTFERIGREFGLEGRRIAIDDSIRGVDLIDMTEIMKAKFIHEGNITKELRIMKSEEEIRLLQGAARIADRTFEEILRFIQPGVSEKQISDKLKELLITSGGEDISFEPIVASGPNSSMPHYSGSDRIIEEQDLIILDFGCMYKGYCSDISRMVFVGEPTEEQRKIYEIVLRANTTAEEKAKAGMAAEEVDKTARDIISEAGYGQFFINRTGHGIGIEIHEHPFIKDGNKELLKTGMAFSIEPGIYIPGKFGMRIEDIVVVEEAGVKILNKAVKEMVII